MEEKKRGKKKPLLPHSEKSSCLTNEAHVFCGPVKIYGLLKTSFNVPAHFCVAEVH